MEGGRTLVVLQEVRQRDALAIDIDERSTADRDRREQELLLTRKRLTTLQQEYDSTEQELRSTNEELLSMNEELQSSNEELETSREELQSINEELETINAELTENNRQLTRANSDLRNLLESTDIATLFLDANHCVRLYTPEATRLFGMRERDLGRPISELACQVSYPELRDDLDAVQKTLRPIEREVRIEAADETFEARVRPYRTVDDRLDGCVLTFLDVTTRKRQERRLLDNSRALAEQYAELEALYDQTPVGLSLADRDIRYLRINAELATINGIPPEDHIGRLQEELLPAVHAEIEPYQRRVLETGQPVRGLVVRNETPAEPGRIREWIVDFFPVSAEGRVFAIGSCVREVTKERELERELARNAALIAESEARLRRLFDEAPAYIAMHEGPQHVYIYSNPLHDDVVGGRALIGRPLREAMPELAGQRLAELFDETFRSGEPVETRELRAVLDSAEGPQEGFYRQILQPWFDADGRVAGVMSFAYDITEEVRSRQALAAGRERLQKVQDSLDAFVGLLDREGVLREANRTALERAGLTRDDVIGRPFWECWWWTHDPDLQERVRNAVAAAAEGETVQFEARIRLLGDASALVDFRLAPNLDADGRVTELIPSAVDITERRQAEERKDLLLAELQHRVKNVLATVQSIMRFSARTAADKEALVEALQRRFQAIARTHDALTRSDWSGHRLRDLVEAEVSPYAPAEGGRLTYRGPNVALPPSQALSIGLALHELATNAAKHGALSAIEGRITMRVESLDGRLLELDWKETGGPATSTPTREGFGTFLLKRVLSAELGAEVDLLYERDGLRCRMMVEKIES